MNLKLNQDELTALAESLLKEYAENPKRIWLQDFFIQRMITKTRIKELCRQSKDFAEAYSLCQDIQESRLFKLGLSGKPGTQAVISLALKNLAGWQTDPKELPQDHERAIVILKPTRLAESDADIDDDTDDEQEQDA